MERPGTGDPRKPDESRINSGNPGRENHQPVGTPAATIPIRDLVDVTVAARIEPESVDAVLAGCTQDERIRIIENLEATPSDQHKKDPKKITGSTYKIELEGLAQQMITMIAEGTAEAAPPASERRVAGKRRTSAKGPKK